MPGPFHPWNGDQGDDFFNTFGLPEHDNDQQALTAQIPANASIDIENPRGDVSITAGDASTIEVQAHQVAYADSDAEAKKIFDAEAAHLTSKRQLRAGQVGQQLTAGAST